MVNGTGGVSDGTKIMRGINRRRLREDRSHARLDILFLLLFPLFFLVFNVIYWLSFMNYGECSNCYDIPDPSFIVP